MENRLTSQLVNSDFDFYSSVSSRIFLVTFAEKNSIIENMQLGNLAVLCELIAAHKNSYPPEILSKYFVIMVKQNRYTPHNVL